MSGASSRSSSSSVAVASSSDRRQIKPLREEVVNRIAAGEVIQRPCSAIKELIENSLDAGATRISVLLADGGLKMFQVTDNGCGIHVDDYPILCHKYTTSKIESFEDLSSVNTFGFRGEALASITYVSRVTITSLSKGAEVAYRASFFDGKLVQNPQTKSAKPEPCAGIQGTIIRAEDLFFNTPLRRNALKSKNDEYKRCVHVLSRYALHYSGVAFKCQKQGSNKADINTQQNASYKTNIRNLFGARISKDILELKTVEDPDLQVKARGWTTHANFSQPKATFILFINNRLVQSTSIQKAFSRIYSTYLPKGAHAFTYLALEIFPANLDVNVHPTKSEVFFLHEERIVAFLETALEALLAGANESRTFLVHTIRSATSEVSVTARSPKKQTLLVSRHSDSRGDREKRRTPDVVDLSQVKIRKKPKKAYVPNRMVRTDDSATTLDAFFMKPPDSQLTQQQQQQAGNSSQSSQSDTPLSPTQSRAMVAPSAPDKERKDCGLRSVHDLLAETEARRHEGFTNIMRKNTFVGFMSFDSDPLMLLQHKTKLFLLDLGNLTYEYLYQLILHNFGNLSRVSLTPSAPVARLVLMALTQDTEGVSSEAQRKAAVDIAWILLDKADILSEYFSIDIVTDDDAKDELDSIVLQCIPELVPYYFPPVARLGSFLLGLSECVWTEESACFRSVAMEIAAFYKFQNPSLYDNDAAALPDNETSVTTATATPSLVSDSEPDSSLDAAASVADSGERRLQWLIQHSLLPGMRSNKFSLSKDLAANGTITEVAELNGLYKIFERC
jgi:DNA mismatch repair protein MLH1